MNKLILALQSRTVWTVVGMFVIGGLNAIVPVIPGDLAGLLNALLAGLAIYFHVNPSQNYSK